MIIMEHCMRYLVADNLISYIVESTQAKYSRAAGHLSTGACVVTATTMASTLSGPRGGAILPGFPEWVGQAGESCLLC